MFEICLFSPKVRFRNHRVWKCTKWIDEGHSPITAKLFNDILKPVWKISQYPFSYERWDGIGKYRPISLMSNVYKLFAKILLETLDKNQPIEPVGCKKNYSVTDHIHTINQILGKIQRIPEAHLSNLYQIFESIWHPNYNYTWSSLKKHGVNNTYIDIIKNIYNLSKRHIKLESKRDPLPVNTGVRQGHPISPKLLNAVLEKIFKMTGTIMVSTSLAAA